MRRLSSKRRMHFFWFFFTARRVWRDYFPAVDAVVFVIDAAERDAFWESSQELHVRPTYTPLVYHNISIMPLLYSWAICVHICFPVQKYALPYFLYCCTKALIWNYSAHYIALLGKQLWELEHQFSQLMQRYSEKMLVIGYSLFYTSAPVV